MSLKQLSQLRRDAEKELKELGFGFFSIEKIVNGEQVVKSVDSEEEAVALVEKYKASGMRASFWTSGGEHGYPEQYKVSVGL